ncbi:MAG: hypothetical protein ACR2PL_25585 [Dehalococcoidia bacterium]
MKNLEQWLAKRSVEDEHLYERFGKALEPEHTGKWVAIGEAGAIIVGTEDVAVAREASQRFGDGQYAMRRIGWAYDYRIRWVHL